MSNPTPTLPDAASAVVGFGSCQADIDALDETTLQAGMAAVRQVEEALQPYKL